MKDLPSRSDWLTIVAVAAITHSLSTLVHEGAGHGGACLLVHCKPQLMTTMQFEGDDRGLSSAAIRFIAAGGTIANLIVAAIAGAFLRSRKQTDAGWLFLWLLTTVSLLTATGYPLYSGVGNIGDWADVVRGFSPRWMWRVGLTVVGGSTYWLSTRWAMSQLGSRLDAPGNARVALANRYTLVAYATGGTLAIAAGLRDPGGAFLILISGAAASLGGTSALAWGPQLLHNPALGARSGAALVVTRNWWVIGIGALAAAVFIGVVGAGIHFN